MRKTTLLLLISLLSLTSISLFFPCDSYAASQSHMRVDRIDHVVAPVYGGLLFINDTVTISPTTENATIERFSIGFPLEYKANLRFSMAYDAEDFDEKLDVVLDTGLGVVGYYGVTIVFPNGGVTLDINQSYAFTVVFVFSDLIDSSIRAAGNETEYQFTASFPVYPSLAQNASTCNITVILPKQTTYVPNVPNDFLFNATQKHDRYYLNHTRINLPSFIRTSTEVSFATKIGDLFACFSVDKLTREITIDTDGHVSISELFLLKSKTTFTIDHIHLQLPSTLSGNITAFDEQGRELVIEPVSRQNDTYGIPLHPYSFVENQSRSFKLTYTLERDSNLIKIDSRNYKLNLSLLENLRIMPKTLTMKIIFPEGAAIQSFPQQRFSIQRDAFQETLTLSIFNITWLQNQQWTFTYSYAVFWTSFRPTLWAAALVAIGSIIAFAWRRPKAPTPVPLLQALVPRKTLNQFLETYEEKKRILSEREQIRRKARKGKISRRRYKIRKTTLENKLSTLSRTLTELRQKIASGGAKYTDMMRRLEVAEIELDNIEADVRRIEVRFKRGEISAQTYRRLMEDDLHRQEKAETRIDGVLLRLRE